MTYREIVAEVERLPQAEQHSLLKWLSQRIPPKPRRVTSEIPPATLVRGIARPTGKMPTDEEIRDDYTNYLIEKYL